MHGGIKARETSLARDWQGQVLYNLFLYWKGRMPGRASETVVSTSSINTSVHPAMLAAPGVIAPAGLGRRPAPAVPPDGFPDIVP